MTEFSQPLSDLSLAFVITGSDNGGGHVETMCAIADQLKRDCQSYFVVSVGDSPIPSGSDRFGQQYYHLTPDWPKVIAAKIKKILACYQTNIVHCFDVPAYATVSSISHLRAERVLIKCGGGNDGYLPEKSNIIFFSGENYDNAVAKSKHGNYSLISNRIKPFEEDCDRVAALKKQLPETDFIVLRIGRVSSYYKKSILETINFSRQIQAVLGNEINVLALFIGRQQDFNIPRDSDLSGEEKISIFHVDNPEYCVNARELLNIGDIVVGCGRSAIESLIKKIPTFVPTKNLEYPRIVSEHNFQLLRWSNFSERSILPNTEDASGDLGMAEAAYYNGRALSADSHQTLSRIASEFYSTDHLSAEYEKFYKNLVETKLGFKFFVFSYIRACRAYHVFKNFREMKNYVRKILKYK